MIQGNERVVSLTGHDENRECKCPSAPLLKGAKASREEAQELVEMFLVNKIRNIGNKSLELGFSSRNLCNFNMERFENDEKER